MNPQDGLQKTLGCFTRAYASARTRRARGSNTQHELMDFARFIVMIGDQAIRRVLRRLPNAQYLRDMVMAGQRLYQPLSLAILSWVLLAKERIDDSH